MLCVLNPKTLDAEPWGFSLGQEGGSSPETASSGQQGPCLRRRRRHLLPPTSWPWLVPGCWVCSAPSAFASLPGRCGGAGGCPALGQPLPVSQRGAPHDASRLCTPQPCTPPPQVANNHPRVTTPDPSLQTEPPAAPAPAKHPAEEGHGAGPICVPPQPCRASAPCPLRLSRPLRPTQPSPSRFAGHKMSVISAACLGHRSEKHKKGGEGGWGER